jgi:hypothetical protein
MTSRYPRERDKVDRKKRRAADTPAGRGAPPAGRGASPAGRGASPAGRRSLPTGL